MKFIDFVLLNFEKYGQNIRTIPLVQTEFFIYKNNMKEQMKGYILLSIQSLRTKRIMVTKGQLMNFFLY